MTLTPAAAPTPSWSNITLMSTAHFVSDFFCNVLPVMLPLIALQYGISYSQSAALFMAFSVSTNFLQPAIGIAADRRNLGILMPLSVATGAISASLIGSAPGLVSLVLIVLLSGVCASAFHPIGSLAVYAVSIKRRRSLSTSLFIAGGTIGFAIAPVVVAFFIEKFGQRNLWIMAIPALVVTALIVKQRLHCLSPQSRIDTKDSQAFRTLLSSSFVGINLAMALRSWGYCAMVVFLPLFLTSRGITIVESAFALMIFLIGTTAGGLVTGSLSDILGLKKVITLTFMVSLAGLALFLFLSDTSLPALAALFAAGAGMYGSTPAAIVWSQRIMPQYAAFAASMMLGFTFGLGYIESVITGILGDLWDLRTALAVTVLPAMAAAALVMAFLKEPKEKENKNILP